MSDQTNESIVIRRAQPEDFRGLQRIHGQPRTVCGALPLPYPSAQSWRQRLERQANDHYGLVACFARDVVGGLGLAVPEHAPRRAHVGQIGMVVHAAWQRRGIGTALLRAAIEVADRVLNLRRLEVTTDVDDLPARRLFEKFGFEIEGLLRMHSLRNGAWVDAYSLARIR